MSSVRRTSTWTNRGKIKVNHDGIAALNFGRTSASTFHLFNIFIFDSKDSVSVACVCVCVLRVIQRRTVNTILSDGVDSILSTQTLTRSVFRES